MNSKIIAVWGSPASGKSTASMAIASALAQKKKNILLLNASSTVPAIPVFIPSVKDMTSANSLGSLLSAKAIDKAILRGKIHQHPASSHIGVMGYCPGDTPISYDTPDRNRIRELYALLSELEFDYIIADCESNPVYDIFTMSSLEIADTVLRIITPDVKGIEFERAQTKWLKSSKSFRLEKHIRICAPVKSTSPLRDIEAVTEKFSYTLPYSDEVSDNFSAGKLQRRLSLDSGIEYESIISKVLEVIE